MSAAPTSIAELAPELDLLIGADDVLLELAIAGAVGWVAGYPNALPARHASSCTGRRGGRPRRPRCRSTGSCTRCCAGTPRSSSCRPSSCPWTSSGRHGGPVPPAARAAAAGAGGGGARGHREGRRGRARISRIRRRTVMRSKLVLHAVDSHTEGMPTRVITGGIGIDPRRDHERAAAVLPRTPRPRPAVADERAARPRRDERRDPPAADPPRLRLRRALHRGLRLSADVRTRHDRRGDRARRDRHGARSSSRSPPSASTPRPGSSSPRCAVRGRRGEGRHPAERAVVRRRPRPQGRRSPTGGR